MYERPDISIPRRVALGGFAATAAGFALFGPRPLRDPRDGRVIVDYWEKWTGYEADAMRGVVDAFNRSQDRIRVRFLSVDRLDQKARIAIAGGDPPDVLGVWTHNLAEYTETGAAVPLDGLDTDFGLTGDVYLPAMTDFMHHGGHRMAAVSSTSSCALYYNRALFREAGLDPDRPPTTFGELAEYNRILTKRVSTRGSDEIERVGFHPLEPAWWPWSWPYYAGVGLWDDRTDRPMLIDPRVMAVYDRLYRDFVEPYGARSLERFLAGNGPYNSTRNPFLTGRVAMVMQGAFLVNVIERHNPSLDYAAAPFPVSEDLAGSNQSWPRGAVEADLLMIPRGARSPEAALEFIAFTQGRGAAEAVAHTHRKFSPLAQTSAGFVSGHPNPHLALHRRIAEGPGAFHVPIHPLWTECLSELNVAMRVVLSGRATAAEVFPMAQQRLDQRVDQLEHKRELRRKRAVS